MQMARKAAKRGAKATKRSAKKRPAAKKRAIKRARPSPSTRHTRVTAGQSHGRPKMGMARKARTTHVGDTAHFTVSYLTGLGQKGASLGRAILQNCERDYAALQQDFGGITPGRLPFKVQITADNTGASHSSCL